MLVELSGIDGSGKSTQLALLQGWCNQSGLPCYHRPIRSTARRVLGGIAAELGHASWQDVFDRDAVELATALEVRQTVFGTILPTLFPGQVIVCDSYLRTWVAAAHANAPARRSELGLVYRTIPAPDLAIHIDLPVEEAMERIERRPKGDHIQRYGGTQRLGALAAGFAWADELLAYEAVTIDGTQVPEQLADTIRKRVASWLRERGQDSEGPR